jgi:hypothetical protein
MTLIYGSDLMLVQLGTMTGLELNPTRALYPRNGLVLPLPLTTGAHASIVVATPADLAGFADLQAVTLMKPACLPLAVHSIGPGLIETSLSTDARARRLADMVLTVIARAQAPASPGSAAYPSTRQQKERHT